MFITDEEKNKIALSSAMALPDDPSRAGMKPDQIKRVLFAPTKKLIEYLNKKLKNYDDLAPYKEVASIVDAGWVEVEGSQNLLKLSIKLRNKDKEELSESIVYFLMPTIVVEQTSYGALITATDKNGTTTAKIDHSYKPVKGVDYFTDADKKEFIDAVKASIPQNDGGTKEYKIKTHLDTSNYKLTVALTDDNDNIVSSSVVDLPLETMVVDGDEQDGIVTLTLQNGNTITFDIGDLVDGLVSQTKHDDDIAAITARIDALEKNSVSNAILTEIDALIGEGV